MERMVPWCRYPIVVAQWIHHTSSVPWRMVRTPGGIGMHRTTRTPFFFWTRERGREKQREREGRAQWERIREEQQERKSRGEQGRLGGRE